MQTGNKNILLVEDDANVAALITKGLGEEGFNVTVAFDGDMGFQIYESGQFDLIILDIMMPGQNGIQLCGKIRSLDRKVPILFLSALGTSENIVLGLNTGADDYIVKPFKFIELLARVRTLLRRSELINGESEKESPSNENIYRFASIEIDDAAKVVTREGNEIQLTSTEYKLLLFFVQNPNIVHSRMDILEQVWGVNFNLATNVVDVYVNYLRKKIDQGFEDKLIHTVIGMGYILKEK